MSDNDHMRSGRLHAAVAVWLLALLLAPSGILGQGAGLASLQAVGDVGPSAQIARNGVPTRERLRGTYLDGGVLYLRLADLGGYLSARDRFDFKNKYELVVGNKRLMFTLGSTSVIIDGDTRQSVNLPRPVELHRGVLYAPAAGVADVLSAFTGRECEFLPEHEWLNYGGSGLNVLGLDFIHNPDQGTQVTILTTEPIAYDHFSDGNGVINVTLEGARADVAAMRRTTPRGLVRRIEVFEQGDDVFQVSFHLSRRYRDRPTFFQTPDGIVFVLRQTSAGERLPDGSTVATVAVSRKTIQTVIIDAGHGGRDPGSIGGSGLREKEAALDIALRLRDRFQKDPRTQDIQVVMTRSDDTFIPLPERTLIANEQNGDIFISIHANSWVDAAVNGFMTFFLAEAKNNESRQIAALENSALEYERTPSAQQIEGADLLKGILGELISTRYLEESQDLAGIIQDEMTTKIGQEVRSRRLDQGPFYVLNGAYMPAVLVEVAFISNRAEEQYLRQNAFKNKVADAIHEAVIKYREQVEVGGR